MQVKQTMQLRLFQKKCFSISVKARPVLQYRCRTIDYFRHNKLVLKHRLYSILEIYMENLKMSLHLIEQTARE